MAKPLTFNIGFVSKSGSKEGTITEIKEI